MIKEDLAKYIADYIEYEEDLNSGNLSDDMILQALEAFESVNNVGIVFHDYKNEGKNG